MTVEFVPNGDDCYQLSLANGTWFELLNNTGVGNIVNPQNTNDEIVATEEDALRCADALADWCPPEGWYSLGKEQKGKEMVIDFFERCGGFTTY